MSCAACGSSDLEEDDVRGHLVCVACGAVQQESVGVSVVTFTGHGTGSDAVHGQFVRPNEPDGLSGALRSAAGALRISTGRKTAAERALGEARDVLGRQASVARVPPSAADAARRLLELAHQNGFNRGREVRVVTAASLYIACRRSRTPHMLLDLSDAASVNMFVLGSACVRLARALHLTMPVMDPSMYMHRFADGLSFGDSARTVARTALRLLQSMQRDWLTTGRHPAGVCGACLLIAARLHGFRRSQREVLEVVRVSEKTIRARLSEFESTPAAGLTLDELMASDPAAAGPAMDPPAMRRRRRKKRGRPAADDNDDPEEAAAAEEAAAEMRGALEAPELRRLLGDAAGGAATAQRAQRADGAPGRAAPGESDSFSDVDDDEVASSLLSPEEAALKRRVWEEIHAEYEAEQAAKERDRAVREAGGDYVRKRRRKGEDGAPKREPAALASSDPAQAALNALRSTRLSAGLREGAVRRLLGASAPVAAVPKRAAPQPPAAAPAPASAGDGGDNSDSGGGDDSDDAGMTPAEAARLAASCSVALGSGSDVDSDDGDSDICSEHSGGGGDYDW